MLLWEESGSCILQFEENVHGGYIVLLYRTGLWGSACVCDSQQSHLPAGRLSRGSDLGWEQMCVSLCSVGFWSEAKCIMSSLSICFLFAQLDFAFFWFISLKCARCGDIGKNISNILIHWVRERSWHVGKGDDETQVQTFSFWSRVCVFATGTREKQWNTRRRIWAAIIRSVVAESWGHHCPSCVN